MKNEKKEMSWIEQIMFEDMVNDIKKAVIPGTKAIDEGDWDEAKSCLFYSAFAASQLLKERYHQIPPELRREVAFYHYTNKGDQYAIIRRIVRQSLKYRPENWRKDLPMIVRNLDTFTVYRAGSESIEDTPKRMSWTLARDVAEWFLLYNQQNMEATGKVKPQYLYKATIPADKVIAYLNDRKEYEILQYKSVENVELITPRGVNEGFMEAREYGDALSLSYLYEAAGEDNPTYKSVLPRKHGTKKKHITV